MINNNFDYEKRINELIVEMDEQPDVKRQEITSPKLLFSVIDLLADVNPMVFIAAALWLFIIFIMF